MAKLYKTDGTIETVSPKNGKNFSLDELRGFVGGLIDIQATDENLLFVFNDEGKLMNLPLNDKATELYQKEVYKGDFLVGDVLICNDNEIE